MGPDIAAAGFSALGASARLEILRLLVRTGPSGLSIGHIQARLELPPSTLAHHLRTLCAAGLVQQSRDGRSVNNRANFELVGTLAAYLTDECCRDEAPGLPEGQSA